MADAMTDSKVPLNVKIYIRNNLGNNWQSVGRLLVADPNDEFDCVLDDIDKRFDNLPEKSYQMLRKWQERKGEEATPQALVQALKDDNRNDLARQVEKMMNMAVAHSNPKTPAAAEPAEQEERSPKQPKTVIDFFTSLIRNQNTHVWNNTQQTIRVTLTDTNDDSTAQILRPDELYNFKTPYGRVRVSVFRRSSDGSFAAQAEGKISGDSDRSFIVEEVEGVLTFYRALYGKLRVKETGM